MKTLEERFWSRVDFSGAAAGSACWECTLAPNDEGYCKLRLGRAYEDFILAHRFSWQLHFGLIPAGLFVCHHCDNPGCIRPEHLFLGTQKDNMQDCSQKGRTKGGAPSGEKNPKAKLTTKEVLEIRLAYEKRQGFFWGCKELSRKYGVSRLTIKRICNNQTWRI